MAKRDLSREFRELDSEDFSGLETSVPTDISLSTDSELGLAEDRKKKVTKQLLERKQMIHDIQVLKIEVSQKGLVIDNLKAEHMQKIEELEERLSDALHQKQILQARLESQLKIQQDEARRRQDLIQKELENILKKQKVLENANELLQEKAGDIRRNLQDLELAESKYQELSLKPQDELSARDFVAVIKFI